MFAGGTIGYRLIENAGWWHSFYMTVITLTTVGYREVFPLSRTGEVFTVVLLFAGLGLILLVAMEIGRTVLEGELREVFGQVRRSRMIENLSGHEIVCGFGRMGQAVVEELRRRWNVGVVAVQRADTIFPNPVADFAFSAGDVLVILGAGAALNGFETVCRAAATVEV